MCPAAQRRLPEAMDPLVTELLSLALDDVTDPRVQLTAIRDALDRVHGVPTPSTGPGLGPTRKPPWVT